LVGWKSARRFITQREAPIPEAGTAIDVDPALSVKTRKETFRQADEAEAFVV